MTYNHKDNIQELIKNTGIDSNDFYDYSENDPFEIVERYFQFCQTNLTEKCDKYLIQPARIYIRKNMNVNGRAGKVREYYIIAVNFGTKLTLFRLYTDHRKIFDSDLLEEYRKLNESLDVSFDYLLFQISSQFTYYHELAHLIQKSPLQNHWLEEAYENESSQSDFYSLERHVYEFDADLYASNNIAFHIIEYWKKQKDEFRTPELLSLLISVGVAAVGSYFIFLLRNYKKVYYKASTHPHPIIRLTYILDNFIKVADDNLDNHNLNSKETVQRGFIIVESLFNEIGTNWVRGFVAQFFEERAQIEEYVNSVLIPKSKEMPELAMNKH